MLEIINANSELSITEWYEGQQIAIADFVEAIAQILDKHSKNSSNT